MENPWCIYGYENLEMRKAKKNLSCVVLCAYIDTWNNEQRLEQM